MNWYKCLWMVSFVCVAHGYGYIVAPWLLHVGCHVSLIGIWGFLIGVLFVCAMFTLIDNLM